MYVLRINLVVPSSAHVSTMLVAGPVLAPNALRAASRGVACSEDPAGCCPAVRFGLVAPWAAWPGVAGVPTRTRRE